MSQLETNLRPDTPSQCGLLLSGLDGANPLGFLAALGVLKLLSRAVHSGESRGTAKPSRISWTTARARWTPVLHTELTESEVVQTLHETLQAQPRSQPFAGAEPGCLKGKIQLDQPAFHAQASAACQAAIQTLRSWADWLAALATETKLDRKSECARTPLDFTAGQQQFLNMARSILESTTPSHLQRTLFKTWNYADAGESLRWDPFDEKRRYALSATDPTNHRDNPIRTEFAANALGFSAIELLTLVDGRPALFSANLRSMRWPIWSAALTLETICSLLVSPVIHGLPDPSLLRSMGITALYESDVVLPVGYYRNFCPSRLIA